MAEYGALQKLLHHVALTSSLVLEATLDAELAFCKNAATEDAARGRHVFVSGLARGGTTILMRSLYGSGRFASLTYADMPFVMAPNLWRRIGGRTKEMAATERAHGDGILVDFNSPEALDEVFWRAFCRDDYVLRNGLVPHDCDDEIIGKFRQYVATILVRYGKSRYLSKNNNNILRLRHLLRAFPNTDILVPFRHPVQHADSLLSQHVRFNAKQGDDSFTRRYMSWLGHHEFGIGHKPFLVEGGISTHSDTGFPDYWLQQWRNVYHYLLKETAPFRDRVTFVGYELFCSQTGPFWESLCKRLDLEAGNPPEMREKVREPVPGADRKLLDESLSIFRTLTDESRKDLLP